MSITAQETPRIPSSADSTENCIKLHHLRGSRVLENQDNQTPPIIVWGPSKAFLEGPLSPTLLTLQYHPVHISRHTYVHTHTHSHTLQCRRPGVSRSTSSPSWPRDGNSAWGRPCPKSQTSGIPTHVHVPGKPPLYKWGN